MEIEKGRITCRPATIDDIPVLVDCRVQFLNEHLQHPEDEDSAVVRKSPLEYFSGTIPSREFTAWVAEYDGRIIARAGFYGLSCLRVGQPPIYLSACRMPNIVFASAYRIEYWRATKPIRKET